ncbi:DUF4355 domain-containing protein [Lentilactobacillus hilgardii]|nr:DUF4355 domain-containing protein [Lentilactobacillus hilgardii]KRK56844.1 hypothetical protein FD42_GL002579 [Lentilactobacillus hilgardii DSM 20176 = ATCC 8290]QEU39384.1 DUF4355 domain-containing protein [Lentilactobacillus hilgardii]TDG85392.1 hypothetical protein C5L34_002650 [Lentilactobacillus hilgardii]
MESDKLNMNLQYFADDGQAGSLSQPGAQGGDGGEGDQNNNNNTQANSRSQSGQSGNDFMKSLVSAVTKANQSDNNPTLNGANQNSQTDTESNGGKPSDADSNQTGDDGKTFTQAEVDKLLKDREFRAHKKGIEEGKKAGKSSAEQYAQMTDAEKQQARIKEIINENNQLKAEKNRSDMRNEVLNQLKDTGYQFTNEDVDTLVSDNPDTTKHNVDNFKSMLDRVVKITKKNMFKNNQIPNSNTQQNNAAPSFGELVAKKTLGDPDRFKGKFFDK